MHKTITKLFIALAISSLTLSACASPTTEPKTLKNYETQKLKWESCYEAFQCTTLTVPIDYNKLEDGDLEISVLRYKALDQKNRIGSLILNPGGPGASGVDYAYNAEYIFNPDILDRFDIVGFDPRGVARSTPIICLNDKETDANLASDSKPDNEAEFQQAIQDSKDFVAKCLKNTKHLENFSTAESARDMDVLRAALGDKELNFLGKSYGTFLGTLYAKFFPDKVGRVVLDGAIDPNISIFDQNLSQTIGFERALEAFLKDCATHKDCPLSEDTNTAKEEIKKFFTDAAAKPYIRKNPVEGDNRVATETIVVIATAASLYDNEEGWPELRKAFTEAKSGYGDKFLEISDIYNGREKDGTYPGRELDSGTVIECLDWKDQRSITDIKKDVAIFTEKAPVFGPYLAYSNLTCKYFPWAKSQSADQKFTAVKTKNPIIVIGTTRDPATPYAWSEALNKILEGSVLISLDADGHTAQGRGSACVDDRVDKFFLTGIAPSSNISCGN